MKPKLKNTSIRIVATVFAIILFMLGLAATGLLDVTSYLLPVVKLAAVIILFTEIGLLSMFGKRTKGLNMLTFVEVLVGALVAIDVITTLFNYSIAPLAMFSSWILLIFGAVFAYESFVR